MTSTHQYCTFYLDHKFFGVDVIAVQEVIRHQPLTRVPLAPAEVGGLMNLRGQIVLAIDLRRRLGLPIRAASQPPMNVVVRTRDGLVSLLVDQIGDVQEVEEHAFERPPETIDPAVGGLIRGAYKLEDRLLLVLDAEEAGKIHVPS